MNTPATALAIATLAPTTLLLMQMSSAVFAPELVVHARQCLDRGAVAAAAGLASRARDAARKWPPKRNAGLWLDAITELEALTGATPRAAEDEVCL